MKNSGESNFRYMAFTLAFTLPHVALLHSVTFYNISGQTWWAKCSPSCLLVHYPYLYPTNLSALIGLRILTPYSLFDVTVHYNLTPLLYL